MADDKQKTVKTEETRRDWDEVQRNQNDVTERLRVKGGHLYRSTTGAGVAMVFVPGDE